MHRPLGMLIGRPADRGLYRGMVVYQAVVLRQALEDIAAAYNNDLTNIQQFF